MTTPLADRVARTLDQPVPDLGPWKRLWWVGTGPFHDAAELGTFPFAGSGRSAAVTAGEGHARLGELLGPQDVCVLVGGDPDLAAFARRVAGGAGAGLTELDPLARPTDDPTTQFVVAATAVLSVCVSLGAPGVTTEDLDRLPAALAAAEADTPALLTGLTGQIIVMGSGPAAVTARHVAVRIRDTNPSWAVEGMDAQDVPGAAADLLTTGTSVIALDPDREPEAPVARMAKMARAEGAAVFPVSVDDGLGPVARTLALAVRSMALLR